MHASRWNIVLCTALLAASAGAQGSVLVVDALGGPGSQFTRIQDAVDYASAGDMVIVRSGSYGRFTLDGKGLALVADAGADVVVGAELGGATQVMNLPQDEVVLLRDIHFSNNIGAFTGGVPPTLTLFGLQGRVWIEGCQMDTGFPSLDIVDCASVTLARCQLTGGSPYSAGISTFLPPGDALISATSTVRLYDCSLAGNGGGSAFEPFSGGSMGSAGAVLASGELYAARTTFQGGDGGEGSASIFDPDICLRAHAGGPGLWLTSPGGVAQLVEFQAAGGEGGSDPCFGAAPSGLPLEVDAGTALFLPGESAGLVISSPVREGELITATVTAPAFSLAVLAWGFAPEDLFVAPLHGVLLVGSPMVLMVLGTLPFAGTLSTAAPAMDLGVGVEGLVLYAQVAGCAGFDCWLGAPSAAVVLDAAF
jgi:hypothetical protein